MLCTVHGVPLPMTARVRRWRIWPKALDLFVYYHGQTPTRERNDQYSYIDVTLVSADSSIV